LLSELLLTLLCDLRSAGSDHLLVTKRDRVG